MKVDLSPEDERFFDIRDFDPEQHRVGPVGLFDGIRINTALLLGNTTGIAFMYTQDDRRGFICLDHQIPQTVRLRDAQGQWHTHTFDDATFATVRTACETAIRKVVGD
jgi:hypothetical protein